MSEFSRDKIVKFAQIAARSIAFAAFVFVSLMAGSSRVWGRCEETWPDRAGMLMALVNVSVGLLLLAGLSIVAIIKIITTVYKTGRRRKNGMDRTYIDLL